MILPHLFYLTILGRITLVRFARFTTQKFSSFKVCGVLQWNAGQMTCGDLAKIVAGVLKPWLSPVLWCVDRGNYAVTIYLLFKWDQQYTGTNESALCVVLLLLCSVVIGLCFVDYFSAEVSCLNLKT